MSRGLGKVQRDILSAVDRDGYAMLHDLAGRYSQPSLSRAAHSLEDRRLVRVEIMPVPIKRKRKGRLAHREPMDSRVWRAVVTSPDVESRQEIREMMARAEES